jgi:hypothetical protein
MVPAKPKPATKAETLVLLELNPASGVDVLGDGTPPLLVTGWEREFTPAEAATLLALTNEHGTPVCREVGARRGADR